MSVCLSSYLTGRQWWRWQRTGLCWEVAVEWKLWGWQNGSHMPFFPNYVIHLLFPQTVPGFAVFLWDNQHNLSSWLTTTNQPDRLLLSIFLLAGCQGFPHPDWLWWESGWSKGIWLAQPDPKRLTFREVGWGQMKGTKKEQEASGWHAAMMWLTVPSVKVRG